MLVLTGCLPQAFPDDERFIEADIILGNKSRSILVANIQQYLTNRVRIVNVNQHQTGDDFESMSITNFSERTRAFVKLRTVAIDFVLTALSPMPVAECVQSLLMS